MFVSQVTFLLLSVERFHPTEITSSAAHVFPSTYHMLFFGGSVCSRVNFPSVQSYVYSPFHAVILRHLPAQLVAVTLTDFCECPS